MSDGWTLELWTDRTGYEHRIQWVSDNDEGGFVGDIDFTTEPPADPEDWPSWAAWNAVRSAPGVEKTRDGFVFERKKEALAALALAKAAVKGQPLADWEAKALAAGWKPPKGRKIP